MKTRKNWLMALLYCFLPALAIFAIAGTEAAVLPRPGGMAALSLDDDIARLAFPPLFSPGPDGNLTSAFLESWSYAPDGTELRMELSPGLVDHAGAAVNAAEVADALVRLANVASPAAWLFEPVVGCPWSGQTPPRGFGIRAIGRHELRLIFQRPCFNFCSRLACTAAGIRFGDTNPGGLGSIRSGPGAQAFDAVADAAEKFRYLDGIRHTREGEADIRSANDFGYLAVHGRNLGAYALHRPRKTYQLLTLSHRMPQHLRERAHQELEQLNRRLILSLSAAADMEEARTIFPEIWTRLTSRSASDRKDGPSPPRKHALRIGIPDTLLARTTVERLQLMASAFEYEVHTSTGAPFPDSRLVYVQWHEWQPPSMDRVINLRALLAEFGDAISPLTAGKIHEVLNAAEARELPRLPLEALDLLEHERALVVLFQNSPDYYVNPVLRDVRVDAWGNLQLQDAWRYPAKE